MIPTVVYKVIGVLATVWLDAQDRLYGDEHNIRNCMVIPLPVQIELQLTVSYRKKQETSKLVVKAILSGFRAIDTGVSITDIYHRDIQAFSQPVNSSIIVRTWSEKPSKSSRMSTGSSVMPSSCKRSMTLLLQ